MGDPATGISVWLLAPAWEWRVLTESARPANGLSCPRAYRLRVRVDGKRSIGYGRVLLNWRAGGPAPTFCAWIGLGSLDGLEGVTGALCLMSSFDLRIGYTNSVLIELNEYTEKGCLRSRRRRGTSVTQPGSSQLQGASHRD